MNKLETSSCVVHARIGNTFVHSITNPIIKSVSSNYKHSKVNEHKYKKLTFNLVKINRRQWIAIIFWFGVVNYASVVLHFLINSL